MAEQATELRGKVALACRILAMEGLVKETTGHVSARLPGSERMFIRARGPAESGLLFTSADEVLETDFDGSDVPDGAPLGKPQELPIHGESYKARPEVMSVVHAHPPFILLCGIAGVELRPLFGAYDPAALRFALDGVPVYPRSILISRAEIGQDMLRCMGDHDACVLRGHGITVHGRSVEEATIRAIKLEALAKINWTASTSGLDTPAISGEDQEFFRTPRGGREPSPLPVWRYYVSLLDRK